MSCEQLRLSSLINFKFVIALSSISDAIWIEFEEI